MKQSAHQDLSGTPDRRDKTDNGRKPMRLHQLSPTNVEKDKMKGKEERELPDDSGTTHNGSDSHLCPDRLS